LGFPALKSNRGATFLRQNFRTFHRLTILAEHSIEGWLLKAMPKQESEIVHEFEFVGRFFDRHYCHDEPPECFPRIAVGTIFFAACLVNASSEILNQ
jgi:hypothetical protein